MISGFSLCFFLVATWGFRHRRTTGWIFHPLKPKLKLPRCCDSWLERIFVSPFRSIPRKRFFFKCKWIERKMVLYVFFTCVFYLNPPKPQIVGMSSSSHLFVQFDKCFAKDFEDDQHLKGIRESVNIDTKCKTSTLQNLPRHDVFKARTRTQWHKHFWMNKKVKGK